MAVETQEMTVGALSDSRCQFYNGIEVGSVDTGTMIPCIDLDEEIVVALRAFEERHVLFEIYKKIQVADFLGVGS